ncbi:hypothetical protein B0F90DRAFT_1759254 [Multifurca ochricompacta]|uniref:Secreted protein n=1 Tax=Multifurca ochricompacta TaxID=376703 RepID=A0AAD4QKA5_9AGAM|nr:hypothetical protein B0F90DRAFT_1759254 [Multifurca ochricompacta]
MLLQSLSYLWDSFIALLIFLPLSSREHFASHSPRIGSAHPHFLGALDLHLLPGDPPQWRILFNRKPYVEDLLTFTRGPSQGRFRRSDLASRIRSSRGS